METSYNCAMWCSATTYQKVNSSIVSKDAMNSFDEMFPGRTNGILRYLAIQLHYFHLVYGSKSSHWKFFGNNWQCLRITCNFCKLVQILVSLQFKVNFFTEMWYMFKTHLQNKCVMTFNQLVSKHRRFLNQYFFSMVESKSRCT